MTDRPVYTVSFVPASFLFKDFPDLWEVFSEFAPFCWGTNSYSLVSFSRICTCLLEEKESLAKAFLEKYTPENGDDFLVDLES